MKKIVTVASTALLGIAAFVGIAWYTGLVDRVLAGGYYNFYWNKKDDYPPINTFYLYYY